MNFHQEDRARNENVMYKIYVFNILKMNVVSILYFFTGP